MSRMKELKSYGLVGHSSSPRQRNVDRGRNRPQSRSPSQADWDENTWTCCSRINARRFGRRRRSGGREQGRAQFRHAYSSRPHRTVKTCRTSLVPGRRRTRPSASPPAGQHTRSDRACTTGISRPGPRCGPAACATMSVPAGRGWFRNRVGSRTRRAARRRPWRLPAAARRPRWRCRGCRSGGGFPRCGAPDRPG